MPRSIRFKNLGPIEEFGRDLPEGGFFVLTGTSGVGKTTALNAVESLTRGGNIPLSRRDGSSEGFVQGFGAWLSVKKTQRRSGTYQLEVESLAGKFALADLVEPGIKDPESADAHRIKALVQLAGAEADKRLFYRVLGGVTEFEQVVGEELTAPDLVSMAKKVKTAIDAAALKQEKAASKAKNEAGVHRQTAGENATGPAPRSVSELNTELEEAIRDEAKLKADRASGLEAQKKAQEAEATLQAAEANYHGPSIEDAKLAADAKLIRLSESQYRVEELKRELEAAEQAVEIARRDEEAANATYQAAKQHAENMAAWRRSIDAAANVSMPSPEEIDAAAKDVQHCRSEIERAIAWREARNQLQRAEQQDAEAKLAAQYAERYRAAAEDVDSVLSEAVGRLNTPLRVKYGRLVLDTDRGEEKFAELSDGERWALAFDIAAPLIPGNGLLTMPQSAFGELPPAVRRTLDEKLRSLGVVCLTAQATDEPEMSAKTFDALAADSINASNEELSA